MSRTLAPQKTEKVVSKKDQKDKEKLMQVMSIASHNTATSGL